MQEFQTGQSCGGAELIGGEAVAVEEGLEFFLLAEEGIEYWLGRERGGHREVAAGETLGQGEEVGLNAFVVAREEGGWGG